MLPGMQKFLKIMKEKKNPKRRNDISYSQVKQNKQSYLGHELICEKGLVWKELPALTTGHCSKRAKRQKIIAGAGPSQCLHSDASGNVLGFARSFTESLRLVCTVKW